MRLLSPSLLRLRNFRCLGIATVLNSIGMMGETVVLGWLALELTNSPFLVGVAMGTRTVPLFFVGIPAGAVADRFPRHRVLVATGVAQALMVATLGVLALLGRASLGTVLLFTFAAGMIRGVEQAARQGYAHDVVGAADLVNGLAVLGIAMRTGWLAGSLGAGAIIAHFGSGVGYLAVAASYLAGAVALLPASAPTDGATARPTGSLWKSVVDFGSAIGRDRVLLVLMLLTAGGEVLGFSHQVVLPSLARDVLHVGPEGLGVMNAARAIGGILGLAGISTRLPAEGSGTLFLTVLIAFGACLVGLGLAPALVGFAGVVIVLVVANAAGALTDLLAQSLMQLSVPARLRGRAGGAWVVAIGLAPLGQLQIGALASLFGVSLALGTTGLGLVGLAVGVWVLFPRLRHL